MHPVFHSNVDKRNIIYLRRSFFLYIHLKLMIITMKKACYCIYDAINISEIIYGRNFLSIDLGWVFISSSFFVN